MFLELVDLSPCIMHGHRLVHGKVWSSGHAHMHTSVFTGQRSSSSSVSLASTLVLLEIQMNLPFAPLGNGKVRVTRLFCRIYKLRPQFDRGTCFFFTAMGISSLPSTSSDYSTYATLGRSSRRAYCFVFPKDSTRVQ